MGPHIYQAKELQLQIRGAIAQPAVPAGNESAATKASVDYNAERQLYTGAVV